MRYAIATAWGMHRASATLCGMPPPFRSGHSLLVFPLLILQTQAVRSLGVAQMLLRAGSMVRGRRYNCDVVLCEAALFNGPNDWVSQLNISHGPPWVVIGDLPHSLHGVSNVLTVNSSMMQRRLRERLEMVFNPNGTPSRALPDMADREHPNPTTAQPCNTPDNATSSMGMSVLSVDDVSMNQRIMGSFLKRLGAQVHLAENGRQACYLNPAPASYPTPPLWCVLEGARDATNSAAYLFDVPLHPNAQNLWPWQEEGGTAILPLRSWGSPKKGDSIRSGYITPAFSGATRGWNCCLTPALSAPLGNGTKSEKAK